MMKTPKEKILSSLECAKILRNGQSLKVLTKVAFGEVNKDNIKKTQKILYKMNKEYGIMYFRETKVWYLLGELQ